MTQLAHEHNVLDLGFLPVGGTQRLYNQALKPPAEVQSVSDLPGRLFMGSIDPNSFKSTDEGWTVDYIDPDPGSYATLQYDRQHNRLCSRFFYQAVEGMVSFSPGDSWKALHQQMSIGFPAKWHDLARSRLEAAFNLRYIREKPDHSTFVGFPDGVFRMLVIPLPAERLSGLVSLLEAIDADADVEAPVHIYVTMTHSRADYQMGLCPDVPGTPDALAQYQRDQTGLPCRELPHYEAIDNANGGEVNLIVSNRRVYLAQVSCVFRDLERVVKHCQQHGYLGDHDPEAVPSQYPHGLEWASMVIPAGYEHLGLNLELYDDNKTRRIVYGTLLRQEYFKLKYVGVEMARSEVLRQLETVELITRNTPVIDTREALTIAIN